MENYNLTQTGEEVQRILNSVQTIDNSVTQNSSHPVTGGAVFSYLNSALSNTVAESGVYDVTVNNNNAKFASLSALLNSENLDTLIPIARRKGGMSIKFVHTYDNKYVQFRLMSDTFNTTPANWQGVDDEPTAGSESLVKSGGALNSIVLAVGGDIKGVQKQDFDKIISSEGSLSNKSATNYAKLIDITKYRGNSLTVTANGVNNAIIAFLTSAVVSKLYPEYAEGENNRRIVSISQTDTFTIPMDCVYLYVVVYNNNADATPNLVVNSNIDKFNGVLNELQRGFNIINKWYSGSVSSIANNIGNCVSNSQRCYSIIQNIPIGSKLCYNVPDGYYISLRETDNRTYPEPASSGWLNDIGEYVTTSNTTIVVSAAKGSSYNQDITVDEANAIIIRLSDSEIQKNTDRIEKTNNKISHINPIGNINKSTSDWQSGNINSSGAIITDPQRINTIITDIEGDFIYYDLPRYLRIAFSERDEGGTTTNSSGFLYDRGYYALTRKKYTYAVLSYVNNAIITAEDSVLINQLVTVSTNIKTEVFSELKSDSDKILSAQKAIEQIETTFSVNGGILDSGSYPRLFGTPTAGSNRVNNANHALNLPIGSIIEYEFNSGYSIAISEYDGVSSSMSPKTGWLNKVNKGRYYVKVGTEVYLNAAKVNGSSITLEDFNANVKFTIKCGVSKDVILLNDSINTKLPLTWEQGTIIDTFAVQSTDDRICSRLFSLPIGTKIHYSVPGGYQLSITEKANANATRTSSGWIFGEGEYTITEGGYLGFICANAGGRGAISPSVGADIFIALKNGITDIYNDVQDLVKDKEYQKEAFVYDGEKININSYYAKPYQTMRSWNNMQGGALYGNKLVCCMAMDELTNPTANGFIYDIETGEKLFDLLFGSTLGSKTYYMPHANQVSFGSRFYDENSDFPLLYVSQVNGGSGNNDIHGERGVLVYNLEKVVEDEEVIGYNPVLVQAIIPDLDDTELMDKLGKYTPNYIVDTDKNQLVVLGYPNASWFNLTGPQPVAIFDVPLLSDGTEIVLTDSDVVDSYTFPVSLGIQQSFYLNGKIYSLGGAAGDASLRQIDLIKKEVVTKIDIRSVVGNEEPQFAGVYKGKFLYYSAGTSGLVREFVF